MGIGFGFSGIRASLRENFSGKSASAGALRGCARRTGISLPFAGGGFYYGGAYENHSSRRRRRRALPMPGFERGRPRRHADRVGRLHRRRSRGAPRRARGARQRGVSIVPLEGGGWVVRLLHGHDRPRPVKYRRLLPRREPRCRNDRRAGARPGVRRRVGCKLPKALQYRSPHKSGGADRGRARKARAQS